MGDDVTEEPPPGSVVLDRDRVAWQRDADLGWLIPGDSGWYPWDLVQSYAPLRLIWTPEDGAS